MSPTAIEGHLALVLVQWMVIIAAAWLVGRLARRVGQPTAVGEILAGIALGPSILGALWPEGQAALFPSKTQQSLQLLAKLGLILMLFQVGLECDPAHLGVRSRTVLSVSLAGILVPVLAGWAIGPWLHARFAPGTDRTGFILFTCTALAISALPVMGRILLELRLEGTRLGAFALSAAAVDDVVGWVLLAVVTALMTSGFSWMSLMLQLAGIALVLAFVTRVVGPWLAGIWRRAAAAGGVGLTPSVLALLLVVLMACCLATYRLGIFSIFGAFLLGVALSAERGLVREWRERHADVVLVALVPVFFTNTGLRPEIGSLSTPSAWLGCALVLAAAAGAKLIGCYAGARATGEDRKVAASLASLMNARGLMGLVVIHAGAELGLFPPMVFTMFVVMALLTTAMTLPLLRVTAPRRPAGRGGIPSPARPATA